ncbi:unnamed protein product [Cyprideis torosa]|uniref:Mic1 domain-containing protein n=1 Tax=Cyprideis torosa TaxID=163714 RepID=A0A7R8W1P0_9CRUS|nr:unnamed protein product [Cyprideis torosa]CAG0881138.1 unnamed protein product [Cyprideis torosa]
MKPAFLTAPGPSTSGGANKTPVQMYSMNWVIRQPNIIIDAKIGRIWTSELNIQGAIDLMRDPIRKVAFIIARSLPDAKDKLLAELRKMIVYRTVGLLEIGKIFDLINDVYRRKLEQRLAQCPPVFREPPSLMISSEGVHSLAPEYVSSPPSPLDAQQKIVLDQGDLLNQVFSPAFRQAEEQATTFVTREKERKGRLPFVHKALVEYIRSLTQVQIPVNHYIFELLLNGMIRNGAFYQMDQLLHYKAIPDSKPMACLLLSLSKVYPPAQQTALDMLLRLETATEEIIEVLLENDHVVPALRFLRDYVDHLDVIWRRKFLEAAERSNDSMAVHAMKSFFDGEPPLITF